ncbi:MAG: leucine-rich repeat domain-containing protein [Anaeroplasmataceae bacterium]|nr:leucine-rich repeat domain-containing protein [Anaeroplasmataceae bacterium]
MKRKFILVFSASLVLIIGIVLLCWFTIPRIQYKYDSETDSYFVNKVYGNADVYKIENEIHHRPVTKICSRAFMGKDIKRIEFGVNLIEIERLAFLDCKKLEEIDLSTVKIIGRNAFENCCKLTSVHLNIEDIMGGTFMGCSSLSQVTLNHTITLGSYAFAGTGIEVITIPDTCSLVGNDVFDSCNSLKKVIVKSHYLEQNSYLKSLNIVTFDFN